MPSSGLLHLFVVYLVWGSTYLAIRLAVVDGQGFPPFYMAGSRILLSSFIFLALAWMKRQKLFQVEKGELGRLIGTGILFWFCGNGFVTFAEKNVESGYAALLIGSGAIWASLLECVLEKKAPSWRLVVGLLVGLSGVAILNGPVWMHGSLGERWASVFLIAAATGWASATVWQKRRPFKMPAEVTTAYQTFIGATALLITAWIVKEPFPQPSHQAWLAWGYLAIFGSAIAFHSYTKALKALPISVVTTYAYVNPLIAVVLGALVLHEAITVWTIAGAGLIVLGVLMVFQEKRWRKSRSIPAPQHQG